MQGDGTSILMKLAEKVRNKYPQARVWLFGSHARGTATKESDLDICVVLPEVHPDDRLAVSDMAWEIGFDCDVHVSTIVVSEKDFEEGPVSSSPLVETIRTEGIAA